MADLKAQIKVDQQLIAGISSNEMVGLCVYVQYTVGATLIGTNLTLTIALLIAGISSNEMVGLCVYVQRTTKLIKG